MKLEYLTPDKYLTPDNFIYTPALGEAYPHAKEWPITLLRELCEGHVRYDFTLEFDELLVAVRSYLSPSDNVLLVYRRGGRLYEFHADNCSDTGWFADEEEADLEVLLHRLDHGSISSYREWDAEIARYLRSREDLA